MKACPLCLSTFEQSVRFCPYHGTHLVSLPVVAFNQGDAFEGFELLERITEDGLGCVFHARREERDYRLRIFAPVFGTLQELRDRLKAAFAESGKYAAPLERIEVSGESDDHILYCASAWHGSRTLDAMLRKHGPYDVSRVYEWLRLIGQGIFDMHEAGVVHGALSLSNLLLGDDNRLYVQDTGLWNVLWDDNFSERNEDNADIIGTILDGMSPEVAKGEPALNCSDIYSLGTIGYQLLTGKPVFDDQTSSEKLHHHITEEIPELSAFNSSVSISDDFQDILSGAVTLNLKGRFQTAKAFLFAFNYIHVPTSEDAHVLPAWVLGVGDAPDASKIGENKSEYKTLVEENLFGAKTVEFAGTAGTTVEIEQNRLKDAIDICVDNDFSERKTRDDMDAVQANILGETPEDRLDASAERLKKDVLVSSTSTELGLRKAFEPNFDLDDDDGWGELTGDDLDPSVTSLVRDGSFLMSDSQVDMLAAEAETDSSSEDLLNDETHLESYSKSNVGSDRSSGEMAFASASQGDIELIAAAAAVLSSPEVAEEVFEEISKSGDSFTTISDKPAENAEPEETSKDSSKEQITADAEQAASEETKRADEAESVLAKEETSAGSYGSGELVVAETLDPDEIDAKVETVNAGTGEPEQNAGDSASTKESKENKKRKKRKKRNNKQDKAEKLEEKEKQSEISESRDKGASKEKEELSASKTPAETATESQESGSNASDDDEDLYAVAAGLPSRFRNVEPMGEVVTTEVAIHQKFADDVLPPYSDEPEISSTHDYTPDPNYVFSLPVPGEDEGAEVSDKPDASDDEKESDAEHTKEESSDEEMTDWFSDAEGEPGNGKSGKKGIFIALAAILVVVAVILAVRYVDEQEKLEQQKQLQTEFEGYSNAFREVIASKPLDYAKRQKANELLAKMRGLDIEHSTVMSNVQAYRKNIKSYSDELEKNYLPYANYRSVRRLSRASEAALKMAANCESLPDNQFDESRIPACAVMDHSMQGAMTGIVMGVDFQTKEKASEMAALGTEIADCMETLAREDKGQENALRNKAGKYREDVKAYQLEQASDFVLPDWQKAMRERVEGLAQKREEKLAAQTAQTEPAEPAVAPTAPVQAAAPAARPTTNNTPSSGSSSATASNNRQRNEAKSGPSEEVELVPNYRGSSTSSTTASSGTTPTVAVKTAEPKPQKDTLAEASVASLQAQAFQAIGQKDYNKADGLLKIALSKEPNNVKLLSTKVTLEEKRGNTTAAIVACREWCSHNKVAACYVKLGDLYAKNNQFIEAKSAYSSAIQLPGANKAQIQQKIDQMESKM